MLLSCVRTKAVAEIAYILCGLTSIACVALLFRGYLATGMPLLFWAALCFVGLTIDNALLFVDLVLLPHVDLSLLRTTAALAGMIVLLYGMILDIR
jgi:Family of unknown function (DUF5985)